MRRAARPLLYLGLVGIVLGLAKIHARYIGHYVLHSTEPSRLLWTVGFIGLLALAGYAAGLPDLPRTPRQAATSSVVAPMGAALAVSLLQLLLGDALLPRFVVFGTVLLAIPWNLACVAVAWGGRSKDEQRDRIVVVGSIDETEQLRQELDATPERPAVILAALTIDEARGDRPRSKPLVEAVMAHRATVVVIGRVAMLDPSVLSQAASLHEVGVRMRTLSLFYEEWLGKLPLSELERASLLFDIRELHGRSYLRTKRLIDIVLSLVGVVALIVLEPFVLVGNLVGNRGPLVYRQERVGKNGKLFTLVKFRTMRIEDGGANANEWTQEDDPRITRFGRVLRKSHIDELPQVLNVLTGDLAIVGPRPEQPRYVEELVGKLPFYDLRHLVRPGMTGWAQVKYGYAGDERDALEKLQYEFWYLRHQSLGLDGRIMVRTVRSVLRGRGR